MNNQTTLQATDMNNKTSVANTVANNQQSAANVQTQMAPEFSYMDDKRQLIRGQAQSAYADAAAYTNAFVSGLKPAEMLKGDHINPWEMMGIPGGASAGTTLAADATSGAGSMQQAKGQAQMAMGGALQQAAATQTALAMKKADIVRL